MILKRIGLHRRNKNEQKPFVSKKIDFSEKPTGTDNISEVYLKP